MAWIETDTLSNQNISSALAIGAYTATFDGFILADISADQVAGNGDYTAYITRQINGAGSAYVVLPKTTMTAASGETAIGGQSGFISVRSGDVLTCYLDGLAGDTTTVDTVVRWYNVTPLQPTTAGRTVDVDADGGVEVDSIQAGAITAAAIATGAIDADALATDAVAEIADGVLDEALAGHTTAGTVGDALNDLTDVTTVTVVSAVSGSNLNITRGDTLSATFTGLASNTDYVSIDFSVKRSLDDADTAAIIRIRLNAPSANDGLLYLNGAAPVAPVVAADGSITVNSATSLTIALAARATDDLTIEEGMVYDIQYIKATGVTTATSGICNVSGDVTRAIA